MTPSKVFVSIIDKVLVASKEPLPRRPKTCDPPYHSKRDEEICGDIMGRYHKEIEAYRKLMVVVANPDEVKIQLWMLNHPWTVPYDQFSSFFFKGDFYEIECEWEIKTECKDPKCQSEYTCRNEGRCCNPHQVVTLKPMRAEQKPNTIKQYKRKTDSKWINQEKGVEHLLNPEVYETREVEELPAIKEKSQLLEKINHSFGEDVVIMKCRDEGMTEIYYVGELTSHHIIVQADSIEEAVGELFISCKVLIDYYEKGESQKAEPVSDNGGGWPCISQTCGDHTDHLRGEGRCEARKAVEGQESIVCAAIWYRELDKMSDKWIPEVEGFMRPKNIQVGIVVCGYRHPSCMYTMIAITGKRSVETECGEYEQGFLTSENRFVDRKEAAIIHKANGGILHYSTEELYSEDIY